MRVYPGDGTVQVTVSGCEMGQGLFTKVAQMAAYKLGVDVSMINVTPTTTAVTSHAVQSGSGTASEASVAVRCCDVLTLSYEWGGGGHLCLSPP